jgi:hypothetical protein
MNTLKLVENCKSLTFIHGRDYLNVECRDENGGYITTLKDVDADYFLYHFEYGQNVSENETDIKRFLRGLI